jgi:predicted DCC family thiol-disulfide oxidoreductase YuxK
LTSERVVARLHGIEADGRVVEGMAAMRGAWRAVGLGWLIAPTGWPLVRYLFDGMYLVFARYRVPLGRLFGRRAASCDTDRCTPR